MVEAARTAMAAGRLDGARPVDGAPGERACELAVPQRHAAVDYDVAYADGVLVRILLCRAVRYRRRIENDDVGEVAFLEPASAAQPQVVGGEARQPPDRRCRRNSPPPWRWLRGWRKSYAASRPA